MKSADRDVDTYGNPGTEQFMGYAKFGEFNNAFAGQQ
jgi:hypothetical protein